MRNQSTIYCATKYEDFNEKFNDENCFEIEGENKGCDINKKCKV